MTLGRHDHEVKMINGKIVLWGVVPQTTISAFDYSACHLAFEENLHHFLCGSGYIDMYMCTCIIQQI